MPLNQIGGACYHGLQSDGRDFHDRRVNWDPMSTPPRKADPSRIAALPPAVGCAARLGLFVAILMISGACQSGPLLAFQGARHYAAGSEALEQGDDERAVLELRRAADLVPHASEIQNHLGLAYLANGQIDRAREAFEIALELDCDNEAAKMNLARLMNPSEGTSRELDASMLRADEGSAGQREKLDGGDSHGG